MFQQEPLSIKIKELEEKVSQLESNLQFIYDNSSDLFIETNSSGEIVFTSKNYLEKFGYNSDDIIGLKLDTFIHPEDLHIFSQNKKVTDELFKNLSHVYNEKITLRHQHKSGGYIWVEVMKNEREDKNNQFILKIVNEQIQTMEELDKTKNFFAAVADNMPAILAVINVENGSYNYVNKGMYEILGYTPEFLSNKLSWGFINSRVNPNDLERMSEQNRIDIEWLNQSPDNYLVQQMEYRILTDKDEWVWLHSYGIPFERDNEGKLLQVINISLDITERKKLEEELSKSLKEKERLLAEIHHRVKNNLSVISNLLQLKANSINDDNVKAVLSDSRSRIQNIIYIHEMLYQSDSLANIEFKKYIKEMIDLMREVYFRDNLEINLEINAEDIYLDINQAFPCSLIINEILSNSFKYAFEGKNKGNIKIQMYKTESTYFLEITDDGNGFDINIKKQNSIGLKLIQGFVNQINGQLKIIHDNGSKFLVSFPVISV